MNRTLSRLISIALAAVAAIALTATPAIAAPTSKPGHCPPGLVKQLSPAEARGLDLTGCDTDATVIVDGVGVALPEPGTGLAAFAVKTGGEEASLIVHTSAEGVVDVTVGAHPATSGAAATAAITRCNDSSYKLMGAKWYSTPYFYVNSAERRPSNITAARWNWLVSTSVSTVKTGKNSCGFGTKISAPGTTRTGTTADANITTSNTCAAPNRTSVVDFGSLSGSTLGLTCIAFASHSGYDQIIASDTRIDSSSRSWVISTSGCSGTRYDVQATLTHEIGHAYGLNHSAERGGNDLMMSPVVSVCNASARLLGMGDVRAMNLLY